MTSGKSQLATPADAPVDSLLVRAIAAFACSSSGLILLAKVYGLGPMHLTWLTFMLPSLLVVAAIWIYSAKHGSHYTAPALLLGLLGGFIGTIGYDLARIPFMLMGQRVFGPISAYGVWLCDASSSSPLTEWTGWLYHFSNGVTFGMMYALVARRRHWGWAVAWAMLLETIALVCPLGQIFSITGNYKAMGIAYLGHVAYGLPLGWIVWRWDAAVTWTQQARRLLRWTAGIAVVAIAIGQFSAYVDTPPSSWQPTWTVEGGRLTPDWLRIEREEFIVVKNYQDTAVSIEINAGKAPVEIPAKGSAQLTFSRPGVFRVHVSTPARSRSSFVIVEPAEAAP
jgi:hypothetical protein